MPYCYKYIHLHIMQRQLLIIIILLWSIVASGIAKAHERIITPKWNTECSDFRHATTDEMGNLTDSYTRMGCDTVNIIDTQCEGDYDISCFMKITNLNEKPYTSYPQYYYNDKGNLCKGTSVKCPVYGWVIGMKDMQHYNVIQMRAAAQDDEIYEIKGVEFRVVTVNDGDTTYHSDWKTCHYNDLVNKSSQHNMWIQYSNNTLWFGGGWSAEIPWDVIYNLPSFGPYTGLYLSAATKVRVDDALIIVVDKESQPHTSITAEQLDQYYRGQTCAFIEGFWDVTINNRKDNRIKMGGDYSLGVVYNGYNYLMIYLDGATIYPGKWKEGDIKAILTPSEAGYYDAIWYDAEGRKMDNALAFFFGKELILDFQNDKTRLTLTRSKRYITPSATSSSASGTGFALTSDGYLATNYHVIRNAENIVVHGLNREFPQSFNADIVAVDSINDLAILHINDDNFIDFGELPYSISDCIGRNGESVFYMGYPKPDILGMDIKTAIGHISAVQDLYLTSVDIDHGSSGSPLFDDEGNVIGVIVSILPNSRTNIEANFVVKSQHLLKLIEKVEGIKLRQVNKIKELSHPDRIEAIAPYVFLLEVTI